MKTLRRLLLTSFLVIALPICNGWIVAQQPSASAIRIVKLNLIVTDRSHHSLDDLTKDEIHVFEDKSPQAISIFTKDERPVNYVVAVDRSGSLKNFLPPVLEAAKLLISGNKETDETMLISFVSSEKINTLQDFTSDKSQLLDKLKNLRIEMGQSAVIDAIYIAFETAAKRKPADTSIRRAVVIISDGEDRASYYNTDALIKLLRAKDVQVFVIGIVTQLDESHGFIRGSPRQAAETLLSRVALETGGRVFFPQDVNQLTQAIAEIIHDLHAQYIVGYETNDNANNERFRRIEVKIESPRREKLIAITRPGYLINPPDLDGKQKKRPSN